MKRFMIIAILLTVTIPSAGCRRGVRCFGLRGGRCGHQAIQPQQPAYYAVPSYSPTVSGPYDCGTCPTTCCPTDCCPPVCCPTDGCSPMEGTVYDGGTSYDSGTRIPHQISPGSSVPQLEGGFNPSPTTDGASNNVYGKPMFSHVVGDRVLKPGESISEGSFKTVSTGLN